jgi:hypothetical protein
LGIDFAADVAGSEEIQSVGKLRIYVNYRNFKLWNSLPNYVVEVNRIKGFKEG